MITKVLAKSLTAQNPSVRKFVSNIVQAQNYLIPISAALFSTSRIVVGKYSWEKAEGTPNAKFRRDEFYKTTFREIGGWTASYFLLWYTMGKVTSLLDKLTGISRWKINNIIDYTGNTRKDLPEFINLNNFNLVLEHKKKFFFNDNFLNLYKNAQQVTLSKGKTKLFKVFNNPFYKQITLDKSNYHALDKTVKNLTNITYAGRITSGILVTLTISGYMLETLNQKYGVKFLSGLEKRATKKEEKKFSHQSFLAETSNTKNSSINQFISQLKNK